MRKERVSLILLALFIGSMAGTVFSNSLVTTPTNYEYSALIFTENDEISTKAVSLLDSLIDDYIDYDVINIDDYNEMTHSAVWSSDSLAFIYVFHGSDDGIQIGNTIISWDSIASDIQNTNVKYHLFLSCSSNKIKNYITDSYYEIKGFDDQIDYFPGAITTAVHLGEALKTVSNKGDLLLEHIADYVDSTYVDFIGRILNPIEPMQALHWKNSYYQAVEDYIDHVIGTLRLNDTEGPLNTLIRLFYQLFSDEDPPEIIITRDDVMHVIESIINKIHFSKKIGPVKFEFSTAIEESAFCEDGYPADIYEKVLRIAIKITVKLKKTIVVEGVPITLYVKIAGMLYFDILLDYYASDHNNPANTIDSRYNNIIYKSTSGNPDDTIYKLRGYAKIPSPYGERTVEAWYSSRFEGIGFTRFYGGIEITPGADIELDFSDYKEENDTDSSALVKKLKSLLPTVTLGPKDVASIWVIATEIDDGLELIFSNTEYIPIPGLTVSTIEIEINTSIFKVTLEAQVKLSITFEGRVLLRPDEIVFDKYIVYWPVIEAEAKVSGEINIGIFKKSGEFTLIDKTGENAFYLPTGKKTSDPTYIANVLWETSPGWRIPCNMNFLSSSLNEIEGAEIVDGSAFDHTPPFITFITPNSGIDPSPEYLNNVVDPISILLNKIDENGDIQVVPISRIITTSILGTLGSVPTQVWANTTYSIGGDNATLDLYSFDEYPVVDGERITTSRVSNVYVFVDDPDALQTRMAQVSSTSILSSSAPVFTYSYSEPDTYLIQAKIKITNPDPAKFAVAFLSSTGTILKVVYGDSETWSPWYSGNSIRIARAYIQPPEFVEVDGELVLRSGVRIIAPSNEDGADITVNVTEVQYKSGIVWSSTDSSSSTHGFIELTSSASNVEGTGEVDGKIGWKGIWRVHMDLYQRRETVGLEDGWHTFYAVAIDNGGLISTATKHYYIDNPDDWEAPVITTSNTHIISDSLSPNKYKAIPVSTSASFDFIINERVLSLVYSDLPYGSGTTSYTLFSGINNSYPIQMQVAIDENTRALRTVSSGTGNGFRFWFASDHAYNTPAGHRPQYSDRVDFRFAAKPLDSYWYIYIRVDTSAGSFYLTYKPGTFNPYYSNGYLFLPLHLEQGNWNLVKLDLLHDVRTVFPSATISTVDAFLARGNWYFDDISIDNTLYDDFEDGSTYGWQIYDSSPAGAKMYVTTDSKAMNVTMVSGITTKIYTTQFQGKTLIKKIIRKYTINLYDIVGPKYNSMLRLYITSGDNNGNTRTYGFWLPVYNEKPGTITVIQPTQSTLPGDSTINIKIRATDPNKISKVRISISDGHYAIMQYSSGYYVYSWRPSKEGSYKITFTIVDTYGFTTSKTINRYVGDFSGSINIISKIYSSKTQTVFLKIKATDPDGVGYIKVLVDNQYVGRMQYSSGYYTLLIHVGSYSNGLHTIKIIMYDHQGDKTTKTTTFYKIPDIHPPDDPIHS